MNNLKKFNNINFGFTLIELLAVIVILAIIALIAIPLIGNVIEKSKIGALENSVNGLVESANMYYANQSIKGEQSTETTFDFANGEQTSSQKLEYKGKVYNGKLILHANGEIAVCIDDKEHYAYKNKDTDEIVSGIGTCLYDGTTGDFSSNSSIKDLRGQTLVATSITESNDGLNAIITIPEEGHYDGTSQISVPIETIKNDISSVNTSGFGFIYCEMPYSWNSTFYIGESTKDRTMTIGSYSGQNGRTTLYITASKSSNMSDAISIVTFGENVNISNGTYNIPAEYSYIKFVRSSVSGTSTAYMKDMYIK